MTIENASINQSQINAKIGEDIDLKLNTKTLRNIKVTQEYNEKEAEDSANVSKQPKPNIPNQSPEQQVMKEKLLMMKLESEVDKNMNTEEFMSDQEYQMISTKVLNNDLSLFNKLDKNRKVEFLIKTYKDISSHSEKVLNNILPYVDALTIKTSFKFYGPENISNNKKIALLNRLAPDSKPQADEAIIALLLASDENVVAGCSLNTLMALRNKEYLGTKFYEQLSQQSSGKLTKAQHKQLALLSAKITTICYAYYIETTFEAVTASIKNKTSLTGNDLKLKGIKDEAKAKILAQLKAENLIDKDNKGVETLDPEKLKASIKNIVGDTLKMKEELEQKQKIAQIQKNIEDIIGETMKLKANFEKSKTN
jgi:hypothetical protein